MLTIEIIFILFIVLELILLLLFILIKRFSLKIFIMPTVIIPDKVCSHCKGIKYNIQYQGKYILHRCIILQKEYKLKYKIKNKEKISQYSKSYYTKSERYKKSQNRKETFRNKRESKCKICKQIKPI